ncbi:hypothetical protein BKA82DRAFT_4012961 [Pisolithus tinctorius]|nr:hypothetical protein BKA82DRAFT_4012961 [Pisolithus tinctorius]
MSTNSPAKFVSIVKRPKPSTANVRPIEPRQSSSREAVQKSGGEASTTASTTKFFPIDSSESLLAQFLQEREPTALAEGGIAAVMDPHENLMNRFLNEREPTAPPADGYEGTNIPCISNVPVESFDLAVDEDNGTNHLTFGMPKRSEMRDLSKKYASPAPYMPRYLATAETPLPATRHSIPPSIGIVHAANAIARELGTAARDQYGAASQGPSTRWVYLLGVLDQGGLCTFEADCQYHRMAAHWFANLAMDLYRVPVILLPSQHATMHTSDTKMMRLQGKGLFSAAWDFFKLMMAQGLWPLPEAPITDVSMAILRSRNMPMLSMVRVNINHFYARWWHCGLLGMASIVYAFLTVELVVYTLL